MSGFFTRVTFHLVPTRNPNVVMWHAARRPPAPAPQQTRAANYAAGVVRRHEHCRIINWTYIDRIVFPVRRREQTTSTLSSWVATAGRKTQYRWNTNKMLCLRVFIYSRRRLTYKTHASHSPDCLRKYNIYSTLSTNIYLSKLYDTCYKNKIFNR